MFDQKRFSAFIHKYQEVTDLASLYFPKSKRTGFEQFLKTLIENENNQNPSRLSQIISLPYYLADLFKNISKSFYRPDNNFSSLLQEIYGFYGKNACVVNFNYDLIFEKTIREIDVTKNTDEYIRSGIKVIKIHGACNWIYPGLVAEERFGHAQKYFSQYAKDWINYFSNNNDIRVEDSPNWSYTKNNNAESHFVYMPALALPVNKNTHVCPESHIQVLKSVLPIINKILIIGWRAQDPRLIELLAEGLPTVNKIPTCIITKDEDKDNTLEKRVRKVYESVPQINIVNINSHGFTEALSEGVIENFLAGN